MHNPDIARYQPGISPLDAEGDAARLWPYALDKEPAGHSAQARQSQAYPLLRRWSPVLAPMLFGSIGLAICAALAAHGIGLTVRHDVLDSAVTLLVFYVVAGVALGVILRLAKSDALWMSMLIAGAAIFAIALLVVTFGPLGGVALVALLAALTLLHTRTHMLRVVPGTVAVTAFFGQGARTLLPGLNLRLPGERLLYIVETSQREYQCPVQVVEVHTATGHRYSAQAEATVIYRVIPLEAQLAANAHDRWEHDLHQLVGIVLRETLAAWSTEVLSSGSPAPQGALAQMMLKELRTWARGWGVWVGSVRVRNAHLDLASTPSPDMSAFPPSLAFGAAQYASGPLMATPVPMRGADTWSGGTMTYQPAQSPFAAPVVPPAPLMDFSPVVPVAAYALPPTPTPSAYVPTPPPAPTLAQPTPSLPTPAPLPVSVTPTPAHADLQQYVGAPMLQPARQGETMASADTLSDSYEAVRLRHITDPATIREIAQAFAQVANRAGDDDYQFDAAAAARILYDYASRLEAEEAHVAPLS